jgi:hypothetical protein
MKRKLSGRKSLEFRSLLASLACLASLCFCGWASASAQDAAKPAASDQPTITYRRVFEHSSPEFIEIILRQDGSAKADVRQLSDPPSPQEFTVNTAYRDQIFDLARQLHNFQKIDLEVHKRVAFMGKKTLRWDQGAETYQAEYNYTIEPKAMQLQKLFENLAQEQADLELLEERLRFDRLGANQYLDQFEGHLNQGMLPQPERFLSVLDKIANDTRLIEVARQRARSLAARIRAGQGQ